MLSIKTMNSAMALQGLLSNYSLLSFKDDEIAEFACIQAKNLIKLLDNKYDKV
jgi:hypothetical protein